MAGAQMGGGLLSGLGQGLASYGNFLGQKELMNLSYGNMFKIQESQQSFLTALNRQNLTQQLFNAKELAQFQQELAGYRTPGAVGMVNRAGLGYPGASYVPANTSTGKLSNSTQTPNLTAREAGPSRQSNGSRIPPNSTRNRSTMTQRDDASVSPSGSLPENQAPLQRRGAIRLTAGERAEQLSRLPPRLLSGTTQSSSVA